MESKKWAKSVVRHRVRRRAQNALNVDWISLSRHTRVCLEDWFGKSLESERQQELWPHAPGGRRRRSVKVLPSVNRDGSPSTCMDAIVWLLWCAFSADAFDGRIVDVLEGNVDTKIDREYMRGSRKRDGQKRLHPPT